MKPEWILLIANAFLLVAVPASAGGRDPTEKAFEAWVQKDVWPEAKAAGVARQTFVAAFAGVTLDLSLPELTTSPPVESQAEFRSPAAYFNEKGIARNVRDGQARLTQWATSLAAIEKRYGVPAATIVAVWARESDFGREKLPERAIQALATGAYLGRRPDLFRRELIAALQILQAGDVTPSAMRSSWAGALGQTQMLPSQVRQYAVDFDGDGRRDIWNSVPDSLASIAHFLAAKGWKRGIGWGFEAKVPAKVSCTLEGPDTANPIAAWATLGVTRADGKPVSRSATAMHLLMPAGRLGPAFLVSDNFYVLKAYNNSDLYALYILALGDRFSDNRPFLGGWGDIPAFGRAAVAVMQADLQKDGTDVGGTDGLIGYKTRIAVGRWQARHARPATCYPDAAMMAAFR